MNDRFERCLIQRYKRKNRFMLMPFDRRREKLLESNDKKTRRSVKIWIVFCISSC